VVVHIPVRNGTNTAVLKARDRIAAPTVEVPAEAVPSPVRTGMNTGVLKAKATDVVAGVPHRFLPRTNGAALVVPNRHKAGNAMNTGVSKTKGPDRVLRRNMEIRVGMRDQVRNGAAAMAVHNTDRAASKANTAVLPMKTTIKARHPVPVVTGRKRTADRVAGLSPARAVLGMNTDSSRAKMKGASPRAATAVPGMRTRTMINKVPAGSNLGRAVNGMNMGVSKAKTNPADRIGRKKGVGRATGAVRVRDKIGMNMADSKAKTNHKEAATGRMRTKMNAVRDVGHVASVPAPINQS
jgi:hypothetical protein